jgi:hypothetical protein
MTHLKTFSDSRFSRGMLVSLPTRALVSINRQ